MEALFPTHNDPIVSILLLLGTIFTVSLLSYAYSLWKQEQKSKELISFVKNFESRECFLDTNSMPFEEGMKKPLFLLALAYQKSGEYAKAIELYLYLIQHTSDSSLLIHLAKAYHKAGFLKRAIDIYIQILANQPRNTEALYELELLYEKLNKFEKAKEVLEVLQAQGEDTTLTSLALSVLEIKHKPAAKEQKFQEIATLYKQSSNPWLLRELFILDPKKAWSYYKPSEFGKVIDILWKLKVNLLDFDIINQNIPLMQLFYANGTIELQQQSRSGIFALDVITAAKMSNIPYAQPAFVYICQKCKQSYPLPSMRCPNCHGVYSFNIEVSIEQTKEKSSDSLQ